VIEPIACEHVSRTYPSPAGAVNALRDVSLAVHAGELVVLVGASGSGKSTLLGLLSGLDQPDSGRILIGGTDIAMLDEAARLALRRSKVGLVFQASGIMPLMTACENVALALQVSGTDATTAAAAAVQALDRVGLGERSKHRAYELSGGEQQRVSLARALIKSPAILLADEPTGQLDSETAGAMFSLLQDVALGGTSVLIATHDEGLAEGADRLLTLTDGVLTT
jgi:putative ABC transport system ATP-binding protein